VLLLSLQQKWLAALSHLAKRVLAIRRVQTMQDPHLLLPNSSFHVLSFDRAFVGHQHYDAHLQGATPGLLHLDPAFYVLLATLPNGTGPLPGLPLELASDAPLASIQQQQAVLVSRLITLRDKLRRLRVTGVYLLFALVTGEFRTYTAEHEEQYAEALRDCRCNPELPKWCWFEKSLQYYFANAEGQLHVLQMRHYENEARIEDMLQQQQLDDSSDDGAAQHTETADPVIGVSAEVEVAVTGSINTST
jgi:hypothetical protein